MLRGRERSKMIGQEKADRSQLNKQEFGSYSEKGTA